MVHSSRPRAHILLTQRVLQCVSGLVVHTKLDQRMRKTSILGFGASSKSSKTTKSSSSLSTPTPPPPGQAKPKPPPNDAWVVEQKFLEQNSLLIPASPDDVDDYVRQIFTRKAFKGGEQWEDWDLVLFALGCALEVFPEQAQFKDYKWIFWTDNALGRKLINLLQALARPESKCLESRSEPEFQFRRIQPPI